MEALQIKCMAGEEILEFSQLVDRDGELEIIAIGKYSTEEYFISKKQAIEIINHLKQVFEI